MKFTSDWRQLKVFNSYLRPDHQDLYHRLTPAAQHYLSLVNPVNLFELKDPAAQLKTFPSVMVRDGLMSLFSFFLLHETPANFKTKLCIHENFCDYVPQQWKDQVEFYSFYFRDISPLGIKPERNSLIVKGLIHDTFEMKSFTGTLKQHPQINQIFFMPTTKPSLCHDSYYDQGNYLEKKLLECWDELKNSGLNVSIVSSEDIKRTLDFNETYFFDLNPTGFIYMDDYTDTYLLSRGSIPLVSAPVPGTETTFDISPYHGIMASHKTSGTNRFEHLKNKFNDLAISPGETDYFHILKDDYESKFASLIKWNFYDRN